MNEVRLRGRLARDPQLRTTSAGLTVANLAIETRREWVSQRELRAVTDLSAVVGWGKMAQLAHTLHKGDPVEIVGRLCTRTWEDKAGETHVRVEVIAASIEPLMLRTPAAAL